MSDFVNPAKVKELEGEETAGVGGIAAWDCVYSSADDLVLPADASAKLTAMVIGISPVAIAAGVKGRIIYGGEVENPSWSFSGANKKLYLKESTSKVSESYPTTGGKWIICLGVTKSATRFQFAPERMLVTEVI